MSQRRPSNQGMAIRLADAVSEAADPAASPDSAIIASGLFAIAASLDRLLVFFETFSQEDDRAKGGAQ